jgi:hypothetical protein
MLSFLPSYLSQFFSARPADAINVPPVKVHEIETAVEKPARALKHLLKLNHANHAIFYKERRLHNETPHVCFPLLIRVSACVS